MAESSEVSSWAAFWSAARRVKVPSQAVFAEGAEAVAPPPAAEGSGRRLERSLGLVDLILLGIGASIGSGIFVITGVAARDAGPAVTLSFALAGLACVVNALCYAELSARFPGLVGGAYLYAYAAFGELVAFILFCHLMLDYHIGAATIARSLASHLSTLLIQLFPATKAWLPAYLSPDSMPLLHGYISFNLLAPLLLFALTVILCRGVRESSTVNGIMTLLKVLIVLLVIGAGSLEVVPSNWQPYFPNGYQAIFSAASVVFFSYVGFDAVANTAEESKNPQRDLPIGILVSLGVCAALYVGVSAVVTGMLPYSQLDPNAPLASAFAAKGLYFVGGLIDLGAVVGLTTTLLAGLYVQARLYMALGRDGFFPKGIAAVSPTRHTPMRAQILVGCIAATMAAFFNVKALSHILSVGVLISYSLVCICVVVLRIEHNPKGLFLGDGHIGAIRRWDEAIVMTGATAFFSFFGGITTRFGAPTWVTVLVFLLTLAPLGPLYWRQVYVPAPGFACPLVPVLPVVGMAFNLYLVAQMHVEAWIRMVVVTLLAVLVYAVYGQFHAGVEARDPNTLTYERIQTDDIVGPLLSMSED